LRDGDPKAYGGSGVLKAVYYVESVIGPALLQQKFDVAKDLVKIDEYMIKLDASKDKSRLGANAMLGVSMACARAGAAARVCSSLSMTWICFSRRTHLWLLKGEPLYRFIQEQLEAAPGGYILPTPFFNVLNGGKHSGNSMAFQEFMIAPVGADSTSHAIQIGSEVYQALKKVLVENFGPTGIVIVQISKEIDSFHGNSDRSR
jgi:enolase